MPTSRHRRSPIGAVREEATDSQPPPDVSDEEPQTGQTTFERIYRTFIASRAALGFALVVTLGVARLFGLRPTPLVSLVSIAYAVLAISMWLLPRFRGSPASEDARDCTADAGWRRSAPTWSASPLCTCWRPGPA